MRLYRWSFEEAEYWVNDSLVLRQFCRVYLQPVPDDTTLIRWASLIGEQTLATLNEQVLQLARQLKVTRGRKLRVDTTVVPTSIHHPTDSALLGDGVRVLSRLLRRARRLAGQLPALAALSKEVFRTRTRACRRLAQQFHRLARRKGADAIAAMKQAYERGVPAKRAQAVTRACVRQAKRVVAALAEAPLAAAGRLQQQLEHFLPLVEQAIGQAWRRVIAGEAVPAKEKVVSLFEPHTQIITRHKAGQPVEFGRKLWLDEVEGGIVSRWELLQEGGGTDQPYLAAALQSHRERFGRAPHLLAADRGVSSPENERLAQEAGVRRVVLPWNGRASPQRRQQERSGWFRRGFRFRAGIEGRVHVLQRDFGLERCLYHGREGMGRWVGWGIVVHNLIQIGRTVTARTAA
jgi:transposase, IS5 family